MVLPGSGMAASKDGVTITCGAHSDPSSSSASSFSPFPFTSPGKIALKIKTRSPRWGARGRSINVVLLFLRAWAEEQIVGGAGEAVMYGGVESPEVRRPC